MALEVSKIQQTPLRTLHVKYKIMGRQENFAVVKAEISGSESFTRWLAPGSELGASWNELERGE